MSADLETLLRDTLAARAETITHGPNWQSPQASARRHRQWVAPLIAAAVVVSVAATVVAIETASHTHPATHPTGTPSPTPVTKSCVTSLPTSWRSALSRGTTTAAANTAFPLDVTSNGSVLVSRDFGNSRDVALVSATGVARRVYSIPSPDQYQVLRATVAGSFALIPVSRLPRAANGVIPVVIRIVLVNVQTGAARTVTAVGARDYKAGANTIDGATMSDGHVYYDVRAHFASQAAAIHDYDIATHTDRVIATSPVEVALGPALQARGVVWAPPYVGGVGVARPLPNEVDKSTDSLVGDDSSYAWIGPGHRIAYWAPGMGVAKEFRIAGATPTSLVTAAGPFVLYETNATGVRVLDTRSGAIVTAPAVEPFATSRHGVIAGYALTGGGKVRPTALVRLDTSKLPELHC